MTIKVLLINGSPRKEGNNSFLLSIAKEKLSNNYELDEVILQKMQQSACTHCDACHVDNRNNCVHTDDTNLLMNKVTNAEILIIATPVYWWAVSAQLKLFIDKFYSKVDLFQKTEKKLALITVGGAELDDPQYRIIDQQFECICKYLNWEYLFNFNATAYEAQEIAQKDNVINSFIACLDESFI
ncbi:flavodoxin family protein [Lentisphaerota bacterium WC36G]|nr:flavodoxin family protein [Lentisphaerae bacterium WC36]